MAKKLFYKIGEACKRLDIQPYVLRYWETEFPLLSPDKSTSGQRVYTEQDLRVIQRIKELLYEEGYTIAGAKKKLEKQDLSSLGELRELNAKADEAESEDDDDGADSEVAESEPKTKAKPRRKSKPGKAKASASAIRASGASGASEAKLRRGIREALKEARAVLELLDS